MTDNPPSHAQISVAIGFGAIIGAEARYGLTLLLQRDWSGGLPWATMLINVAGSTAIGLLLGVLRGPDRRIHFLRLALVTGMLGAFTTFSTFSWEMFTLLRQDAYANVSIYLLVTLLGGIGGCWLAFRSSTRRDRGALR